MITRLFFSIVFFVPLLSYTMERDTLHFFFGADFDLDSVQIIINDSIIFYDIHPCIERCNDPQKRLRFSYVFTDIFEYVYLTVRVKRNKYELYYDSLNTKKYEYQWKECNIVINYNDIMMGYLYYIVDQYPFSSFAELYKWAEYYNALFCKNSFRKYWTYKDQYNITREYGRFVYEGLLIEKNRNVPLWK